MAQCTHATAGRSREWGPVPDAERWPCGKPQSLMSNSSRSVNAFLFIQSRSPYWHWRARRRKGHAKRTCIANQAPSDPIILQMRLKHLYCERVTIVGGTRVVCPFDMSFLQWICTVQSRIEPPGVPDLDRLVIASGGEPLAVRAERHARDRAGMSLERERLLTCGRVPHLHCPIGTGGGES
jgi:hypothetical protein